MMRNFRFLSLVVLLVFASGIYAVPPPRGIDPLEAKRKARIDKIKREKAFRDLFIDLQDTLFAFEKLFLREPHQLKNHINLIEEQLKSGNI